MFFQRAGTITDNLFDGVLFTPMLGCDDYPCTIEGNETLFDITSI